MADEREPLSVKLSKALVAAEALREAIVGVKGDERFYAVAEVEIAIHRLRDAGKELDNLKAIDAQRILVPLRWNVDEPIPYTLTETVAEAAGGA